MRGKIAALTFACGMLVAAGAQADKGRCFTRAHQDTATELETDQRVLGYVDANYPLFARIGVNACMDAHNGLRVTAAWLRIALPADSALDRILQASEARKLKPWSLLLALHANANARLHKQEEAASRANEAREDPIAGLIDKIERDLRR